LQKRENLLYVGIDLHKESHTAVMVNCCNERALSCYQRLYNRKQVKNGKLEMLLTPYITQSDMILPKVTCIALIITLSTFLLSFVV